MKHLIGIIAGFISSVFIFILLSRYDIALAQNVFFVLLIVWIIYARTMISLIEEQLDSIVVLGQLYDKEHDAMEKVFENQEEQIKKQQELIKAQEALHKAYIEHMRAVKNSLVSQKKFLERMGFTPVVTNALGESISYFRDLDQPASEKSER